MEVTQEHNARAMGQVTSQRIPQQQGREAEPLAFHGASDG